MQEARHPCTGSEVSETSNEGKKNNKNERRGTRGVAMISVTFVPTTPKSDLKRWYEDEILKARFKINIVEQAGTALKHKLQRSNPFKDKRCQRTDCMVCRNEEK